MTNDLVLQELSKTAKPKYMKNYDTYVEGDFIQYSGQVWDDKELYAGIDTFLNGNWVVSGEKVVQFQNKFSKKFNVGYSHMVNSGSSANLVLVTAMKSKFNWPDGSEILVSPVGFPTTISPISQNGLTPVFVDIELDTLNFNVDLIEDKITDKTVAILVSPVLGNPPDMDKLSQLCAKHDIILLGDNCDSLGTLWDGHLITDYYYAWTTSFYPAHHISCGEGGMISSNDKNFISIVTSISWWGRDCYCVGSVNLTPCGSCGKRFDKWLPAYDGILDHKYVFTHMGYNLKPLDLQGAIGIEQLLKFDRLEDDRRRYKEKIGSYIDDNIPGVRVIKSTPKSDPSWFGVPMFCDTQELKENLVAYFELNKIQTRNYFSGNLLIHPGYQHLDDYTKYPNSNFALSNVFFIGCSPLYNDKILNYIEKVCKKWK